MGPCNKVSCGRSNLSGSKRTESVVTRGDAKSRCKIVNDAPHCGLPI